MAFRCADCNRFVSTEIEVVDVEVGDFYSNTVDLTLTVAKNCADCGSQVAEASIETSIELPDLDELLKVAEWENV